MSPCWLSSRRRRRSPGLKLRGEKSVSSVLDGFVKGCYFIFLSEFCEQSLLILSFCFEFGTMFFLLQDLLLQACLMDSLCLCSSSRTHACIDA